MVRSCRPVPRTLPGTQQVHNKTLLSARPGPLREGPMREGPMVPNAQGWVLGHPAPSGQMQACGQRVWAQRTTYQVSPATRPHTTTWSYPYTLGSFHLETRKQSHIPARPGLSLPEGLCLHRHPLGLLCYDRDRTRHLNLTLLDTCRRYLPEILRYHGHWTDDVFPGITDLHLCQFFSTRPGFDDSPSC